MLNQLILNCQAATGSVLAQFFDSQLLDYYTILLVLFVVGVLAILLAIGQVLKRQPESNFDPAIIRTFNKRVVASLMMCVILVVALSASRVLTVVLFGLVSFWALREFLTMTPTRRADHRTLFWVLFIFTPAQYVLVALIPDDYLQQTRMNAFALFTLVIPVYASLFIPARIAFTGDHKRFLERTAKIQFGLLICVYALSHAPALLYLDLTQWDPSNNEMKEWSDLPGRKGGLLFFLIVIVQLSDMLHFVWDRLNGKHIIAAGIHPTKSWEGLLGAAVSCAVCGILIQLLFPVTPFTWHGAGVMALLISVMASSGSMTMSAIKRDRGVKDYGTLVAGHAGVLDRIDSFCFAAPIFFHVTRFFLERKVAPVAVPEGVAITIQQLSDFFLI